MDIEGHICIARIPIRRVSRTEPGRRTCGYRGDQASGNQGGPGEEGRPHQQGSRENHRKMKKSIDRVKIRSSVTCKARRGVCRLCYGIDLGRVPLVELGFGRCRRGAGYRQPGTQLTMRTFHVGGVAGSDITQGLPRVEEIFEARAENGSRSGDVDGQVQSINKDGGKTTKILVYGSDKETHEYSVPSGISPQGEGR